MKIRKGEPVIVVPEEQQQIVELERQLAEANTRIETLTRRLEAAEERAEAWEEAALRKAGKAEYDWMEKNRRYNIERAEKAEAQLAAIDRVLEEGEITTVGASFANTADAIRETIAALRQVERERDDWQAEALANRGAEEAADELRAQAVQNANTALREKHALMAVLLLLPGWDKEATVEQNWQRIIERAEELQAERDELQRKLDACQCETRVLNESMLIEARQERNQLAAECVMLRDALERLEGYHTAYVIGYHIAMDKPVKRLEDIEWHEAELQAREALAATPHAAKYAERVKAMEDVLKIARTVISHITHVGFLSATDWEKLEQLLTAFNGLDALDKPEETANDA